MTSPRSASPRQRPFTNMTQLVTCWRTLLTSSWIKVVVLSVTKSHSFTTPLNENHDLLLSADRRYEGTALLSARSPA